MYLTPEEKAEYLAGLAEMRAGGDVDPLMDPYLDRINALLGIVTVESCQGHETGKDYPNLAFLFLRCSDVADKHFESNVVPKLASLYGPEALHDFRKDYFHDGATYGLFFPSHALELVMNQLVTTLELFFFKEIP